MAESVKCPVCEEESNVLVQFGTVEVSRQCKKGHVFCRSSVPSKPAEVVKTAEVNNSKSKKSKKKAPEEIDD